MGKERVNLSIDPGVMQSAREKGLNISSLCEDALRQILNSFEIKTLPDNCEHKWTWPFSVPSGLAKECLKCGIFKKVIVEGHEPKLFKNKNDFEEKYQNWKDGK